jgi:hypothetical protein
VAVLRIVNTNCNYLVIFLTLFVPEENTPLHQHLCEIEILKTEIM